MNSSCLNCLSTAEANVISKLLEISLSIQDQSASFLRWKAIVIKHHLGLDHYEQEKYLPDPRS
jgi:hypothetical protein